MSEPRARRRPAPLEPARAWEYALMLLSRQAYSAAELRRRLLRRGLTEADAERVLARLQELQLIDDALYAQAYVRSRRRSKGPLALREELRRRGLDEAHVERALAEEGEPDQGATAAAVLTAQAWRFEDARSSDREIARKARARAAAFLARRGFEPDAVADALETSWPEER